MCVQVDEMNAARLREAELRHAQGVEEVKEVNRRHKLDYDERVRARKAVEVENHARLVEAKVQHKACLDALQASGHIG
jgi:hypothetical protein